MRKASAERLRALGFCGPRLPVCLAGGHERCLPFVAPHPLERIVYPFDYMEGVHDPSCIGAALPDQLFYPLRCVCRDDLDRAFLLAREPVQEKRQHLLAVSLLCPDEASQIMVDNDREVSVALLVARLVLCLCASGRRCGPIRVQPRSPPTPACRCRPRSSTRSWPALQSMRSGCEQQGTPPTP
jgi:hypothetical protein